MSTMDERFELRPHELNFFKQPQGTGGSCLFTIRLFPSGGERTTLLQECIAVERIASNSSGALSAAYNRVCQANLGNTHSSQYQLLKMQQFSKKCQCFLDTREWNSIDYEPCFRIELAANKGGGSSADFGECSALWVLSIHQNDAPSGQPTVFVKRHVEADVSGKTHAQVLEKLLAGASWNPSVPQAAVVNPRSSSSLGDMNLDNTRAEQKKWEVGKTPMSVTYFNDTYHEQVDVELSERVVSGKKYYVDVGDSNGIGPSNSNQLLTSTSGPSGKVHPSLNGID